MAFAVEILVGIIWILGAMLSIWGYGSLIRGDMSKQYDAEIVGWIAIIFGALLFLPCAIHFSMALTHYWGFSRQACWGYGIPLVLGQALLVLLGRFIQWLAVLVWDMVVIATYAESADEASD